MNNTPNEAGLPPEVSAAMDEWKKCAEWLNKAKAREAELRRYLFNYFFPNPKEGSNTHTAPGLEVKGTHTISRNIDVAALPAVMLQLPRTYWEKDVLIKWAPGFVKNTYTAMTAQDRKTFEQALVITEGMPTLEIVMREAIQPELSQTPIMDKYEKAKQESASAYIVKQATEQKPKKPIVKKPATKKKK